MAEVNLEYYDLEECSVCGKEDEGIGIDIYLENKSGTTYLSCSLAICESCWTKWFKKFQKDK